MKKSQLSGFLLILLASAPAHAQPAPSSGVPDRCGRVSIAEYNWPSAAIFAHIDAAILKHGYGCDIQLVPGDTLSILNSMVNDGYPDISPETWINSARETLDNAVASRELHYMAPAFADGGIEGWWIPAYIAEAHPEIDTVADALERPDLFPSPHDPEKGAIYNCPDGWSCEISTANLFRAYDAADKGFELIEAETGETLEASIADAYENRRGWLGYYWAPTAVLGQYDLVRLSFDAPYDEALWNDCIIDPRCAAPRITSWPRSEVYTVVTDTFARRANGALGYFRNRSLGNEILNDLLAWMEKNDASAEEAAHKFLEENEAVWSEWTTPDAVAAVSRMIARM